MLQWCRYDTCKSKLVQPWRDGCGFCLRALRRTEWERMREATLALTIWVSAALTTYLELRQQRNHNYSGEIEGSLVLCKSETKYSHLRCDTR